MTTTDVLSGGGEMGVMLRALSWAATPLGEPATWPQSLRSAASICLHSRFPIAIYWGPQLALLYNEAWSPILGEKHPWALGRPGHEVWPEIWAEIGPLFETVHQTGEGVWQQDQLLPMHRHGYTEECYFNFTFSPIRGEDGVVVGIFNAVIETTFRVLEERRAQLLRDLAERTAGAQSTEEVCARAALALGTSPADLPFCLLYLREPDAPIFHLAVSTGAPLAAPLRASALDPADPEAPWPVAAAVSAGLPQVVDGLGERFGAALPGGVWPEPVEQAVVVPIMGGQTIEPVGLFVAGVSPRRALDAAYRTFIERVAQQVGSAIGIADAYAAERRRAEALAVIDEAKTAFFSNVSHEFRTPLTLMLGPLEDMLAHADALAPADRERLDVAYRNALRLLRLVNTLLDFSRIEAGRTRATYTPTDLATFTAELASVFRSAIERAGLRYVIDCPPLPAPVYVDREMWEQIVFNLLSNALKFTFEGEIAVALRLAGDTVELGVRDTGTGIPAEELPHLFERFHRVQGAHGRTFEGSGIGLALVQELARLHGGQVRVASVVGAGTTFTVSVPAGAAHLSADRVAADGAAPAASRRGEAYVQEALRWLPEAEGRRDVQDFDLPIDAARLPVARARVVLADDNADMRAYVQRLLSPQYDVVVVSDGVAALRAAQEVPPDLVLSDVMMPGLDGFGLLKALRSNEHTREIPVMLLSARAGEEARVEGMEAGADDYLVKPFSARELLARVGAHLEIARVRREGARRERALRSEAQVARAQLEQVLSGINDQFLALDEDWRYIFVNDHVVNVTGLPKEQLLGRSIWELFPDTVGTAFEQELRQAVASRAPMQFAYYYPSQRRWFENRVYPSASGLALFVADITERKRMELNRQFLFEVGELLAQRAGSDELMASLAARVGDFFDVAHCAFAEFDPAATMAIVRHDWRRLSTEVSLVGTYQVGEFIADEGRHILTNGISLVVKDVETNPHTAGALAQHRALGIGAYLITPFVSGGLLTFALALYQREPYDWHEDEVELLRELTARIWNRIERVRAEQALRASETKLRAALDGARLGAWSWAPDIAHVEADARALELFAIEPAAFTNEVEAIFERIHPEDRAGVRAALEQAARPGGQYEAEFRVLLPDGQVRWLTGAARPRLGDDGRVARVYGVNADVSDRKQTEAALREAQAQRLAEEQAHAARLQRLNVASLAINAAPTRDRLLQVIGDQAHGLLDVQQAFVTLVPDGDWGRAQHVRSPATPDGLSGQPTDWVDTLAVMRFIYDHGRTLRLTGPVPATHPVVSGLTHRGMQRWLNIGVLGTPLHAHDGACIAVVLLAGPAGGGFGEADEALLQQLAQIAAVALENRTLYEQERAARNEAEEASRLKDEFLATVSHELRTPLTSLLGYTQLLLRRRRDEAYVSRTLEKIARSAEAQAQLTDDLLDIARIVSGKLRIEPRWLDLHSVVQAALDTVRPSMEAKGLRLQLDLQPEVGRISGDANRLQQVVWNLLANAVKFTPPGGSIAVSLEADGGSVRLAVSDTGQGIQPEFLPFVFDRFRQADSSSQRAHGGLGLGLSIVRHLVELHGGTVAATSAGVDQGATFMVRLPLASPAEKGVPAVMPGEVFDDSEKYPAQLRGRRVLLVDDQPVILELLEEILIPGGAEVRSCATAREGLDVLRAWRPDLLVSDIAMPGEDGYWLIGNVRALGPEEGGSTPAVALTAYVRMEDRLRVLAAGYQQYVPKPVEPVELLTVLAGVLQGDDQA